MFENVFNNIDRALRTEQGVASELDYAEQTSWLLFLKYLDDLEATRADKAELEGKTSRKSFAGAHGPPRLSMARSIRTR